MSLLYFMFPIFAGVLISWFLSLSFALAVIPMNQKKKKKTSIQSHCIRVIYFFCFSSICCSFIHFAGCTLWRLTFLSVCFDVFGSDVMSASHCYLFAAIGCCFFFLHSATTTTCRTTFLFTENNTHRKNLFALRM